MPRETRGIPRCTREISAQQLQGLSCTQSRRPFVSRRRSSGGCRRRSRDSEREPHLGSLIARCTMMYESSDSRHAVLPSCSSESRRRAAQKERAPDSESVNALPLPRLRHGSGHELQQEMRGGEEGAMKPEEVEHGRRGKKGSEAGDARLQANGKGSSGNVGRRSSAFPCERNNILTATSGRHNSATAAAVDAITAAAAAAVVEGKRLERRRSSTCNERPTASLIRRTTSKHFTHETRG